MKKKIGRILLLLCIIIAVQLNQLQNKCFHQKPAEIYQKIYICNEDGKGWDG